MKYDTSEIRRAAQQVGAAADDLDNAANHDVARMISALPGHFVGEAANALNEELNDLNGDLLALTRGLESVRSELLAYAKRLEAADRAASQSIEVRPAAGGGSAEL